MRKYSMLFAISILWRLALPVFAQSTISCPSGQIDMLDITSFAGPFTWKATPIPST